MQDDFTPGLGELPIGELEGAFFPSTFWLVTGYAKAGLVVRAEALLQKALVNGDALEVVQRASAKLCEAV